MMDTWLPAGERAGGILLHPTSFPSPFGIGDLGPAAQRWLNWLAASGCRIWQVLPLGPTGYGDSPYQSFSAMAGNPLLISPHELASEGLLSAASLEESGGDPDGPVDFGSVIDLKNRLLGQAFAAFGTASADPLRTEYVAFLHRERAWLDDFALFMALKSAHHGAAWTDWPSELALRERGALDRAAEELAEAMEQQRFRQFLYFRQWERLRRRAAELGIRILGDVPIFVAHDSADVWSRPDRFDLDSAGRPRVVAGVPPDYFTETGQLWGNPLYLWERHADEGYAWWIHRLSQTLKLVDAIRLDHFRGFQAHWEVPGGAPTAETGQWVEGPGARFFEAVRAALGSLPIVAEDLGVITAQVRSLRNRFELPGMKVLQFAFSGEADNEHLPHSFRRRCVAYTGTHDNDTTRGWFSSAPEAEQQSCERYLGHAPLDITWDLLRLLWGSVANWAIAPLQDFFSLDSRGRMNFPGRPQGNWSWRFSESQLTPELQAQILELNRTYGRLQVGSPAVR
jgi:4-alpha-glucanotransferase